MDFTLPGKTWLLSPWNQKSCDHVYETLTRLAPKCHQFKYLRPHTYIRRIHIQLTVTGMCAWDFSFCSCPYVFHGPINNHSPILQEVWLNSSVHQGRLAQNHFSGLPLDHTSWIDICLYLPRRNTVILGAQIGTLQNQPKKSILEVPLLLPHLNK